MKSGFVRGTITERVIVKRCANTRKFTWGFGAQQAERNWSTCMRLVIHSRTTCRFVNRQSDGEPTYIITTT